jgi:hypothetical protein
MTDDDRSLERAARSWLEAGPDRAPDHIVRLALDRIATTPQDSVWRFPIGHRRVGGVFGLATVATVVGVFLAGGMLLLQRGPNPGPAVSPSTEPSVGPAASGLPAFSKTFVSERYGYSVRYPDRWQARRATESWTLGLTTSWGAATVDDLHGADVRLSVASQALRPGETPAGRLQAMIDASPICPARLPGPPTVLVGDQVGTVAVNGCSSGSPFFGGISPRGYFYVVFLVLDNRAYEFILDGAVGPDYLQAMLATVTLNPSSAVDPSPAPSAP